MKDYVHYVQYYETDRMNITHHSNYIKWMEEARIHFLQEIGWPYDDLEKQGVICPILSVSIKYLKPTTFADLVTVKLKVTKLTSVRMTVAYEMFDEAGNLVCVGNSDNSFLSPDGQFIRIKQSYPELYAVLGDYVEKKNDWHS